MYSKRSGRKQRNGRKGDRRQRRAVRQHETADDYQLKKSHRSLLDAIDKDTFERCDVLDKASHDVSRGPVVEPAQRQGLNVGVKIASQVTNHPLLEVVVQKDSQPVEEILRDKSRQTDRNQRQKQARLVLANDLIDYHLGDRRKDDDHEGAANGARQRARGHRGIAFDVAKHPCKDVHGTRTRELV